MKKILLLSFLLFVSFNLYAQTKIPENIPTIPYCDLVNNSVSYDQKIVRVRAKYSVGFEMSVFSDKKCSDKYSWVEFDSQADTNTQKEILEKANKLADASTKNPRKNKVVELTVIAKFNGKRTQIIEKVEVKQGYGHLSGYEFQFDILKVEDANVVNLLSNDELILEKGVSPHKEIDAIYKTFSEAYRTLDADKVTNLYTETAAYLAPNENIQEGRTEIRKGFQSFFDWIKREGRTMTISFQIFQRKVDKNLAYDVGIYTIRQFKDGKEVGTGNGKFVVVAIKEKDGNWRFQVDGYSDLKPEKTK